MLTCACLVLTLSIAAYDNVIWCSGTPVYASYVHILSYATLGSMHVLGSVKKCYACTQVVHQLACVVQCKLEQQALAMLRGNALSTATAVAGSG